MNGFLNILKPPGMTSAAVVGYVRRMTGEKRVGHAGTLDPEAAGVLPIMIGRAARLFDYLVDKEKTYVAECAFGAATDTQDATGKIIATGENYPDFSAVQEAAEHLVGDIERAPVSSAPSSRTANPSTNAPAMARMSKPRCVSCMWNPSNCTRKRPTTAFV